MLAQDGLFIYVPRGVVVEQRLLDGTYGICEECGDDISVPRLKARPVTRLCINCKAKQEEDEHLRGD